MFERPKIIALDYRRSRYKEIEGVVSVELTATTPKSAEGFSGVVIHNPSAPECYDSLVDDIVKRNIPLICHGSFLEAMKWGMNDNYNGFSNVYYVSNNAELIKTIREVFLG